MVREIHFDEIDLPRSEVERIVYAPSRQPPPLAKIVGNKKHKKVPQKKVLPKTAAPEVEHTAKHPSGRKKFMG